MEGWIKLHRKLQQWEWYKKEHMVHLFIHLLIEANHAPKKWQGITIDRGQLLTGRKALSEQTGISEQSIRTCINRLKSTNEITIKSTNKNSIITICNYGSYQVAEKNTNQQINQPPNQQLTSNQPATNHKQERKELKNNNTNTPSSENGTSGSVSFEEKFKFFVGMFNGITNRKFTGCAKSKKQLKARINDGYTGEQIKTAITNAYNSSWHKENNHKNLTPEFITRSDKLEMYLNAPSEETQAERTQEEKQRIAAQW